MITLPDITAAVNRFAAHVQQWSAVPAERAANVVWRGEPRRAVTADLATAAAELFAAVAGDAEAFEVRLIVLEVDHFQRCWQTWVEACKRDPQRADPSGSQELWQAHNGMVAKAREVAMVAERWAMRQRRTNRHDY